MGVATVPAGRLDQRITLQLRAPGVGTLGQAQNSWTPVADVWAAAEPLRGREYFAAGQTQSEVTVRFTIRWRANVTAAMRVVWRGQAYDIASVIEPGGHKQMLELMCMNGSGDGR